MTQLAAFKQTTVTANRAQNEWKEACHNFCIQWCSLILPNPQTTEEAATARMTQLRSGGGGSNPALQKVFMNSIAESNQKGRDWKTADDVPIALRGLVRCEYEFDGGDTAFNFQALCNVLAAPKRDAMVYSFTFPIPATPIAGASTGCHSISFFRQQRTNKKGVLAPLSASISIFDPNYGEYLIPYADFGNFFSFLMPKYTDSVTKHRLFYVRENK